MTVRQLDAEALYRNLLASVQRSLAGRDEAPVKAGAFFVGVTAALVRV